MSRPSRAGARAERAPASGATDDVAPESGAADQRTVDAALADGRAVLVWHRTAVPQQGASGRTPPPAVQLPFGLAVGDPRVEHLDANLDASPWGGTPEVGTSTAVPFDGLLARLATRRYAALCVADVLQLSRRPEELTRVFAACQDAYTRLVAGGIVYDLRRARDAFALELAVCGADPVVWVWGSVLREFPAPDGAAPRPSRAGTRGRGDARRAASEDGPDERSTGGSGGRGRRVERRPESGVRARGRTVDGAGAVLPVGAADAGAVRDGAPAAAGGRAGSPRGGTAVGGGRGVARPAPHEGPAAAVRRSARAGAVDLTPTVDAAAPGRGVPPTDARAGDVAGCADAEGGPR